MKTTDLSNLTVEELRSLAYQQSALRCRTDLYFLAKEVLNYTKMTPNTHQELCDYTTSILPNPSHLPKSKGFDPTKNLLLLLMPRGTFKSSVVTVSFTLQMILNDPNVRILIDSETFSKSKAFLREIQDHLIGNEKYREVFKAIHGMYPFETRSKMKLWTDSEIILPCRSRPLKEPTISCAGIDVTKNGMHYDLVIGDDLHSEKNVTNSEQIGQVIEHYKLVFSLLDPGKPLIIIGTRWHELDLYGHIIDFESEDFNILKKSAYNPDGSLFFPEVLSEPALDKIRRRQGASIFSKQYLNEPVSDENATFKKEYFVDKRVPFEQIRGRPINWYWWVDPSYTDPRKIGQYSDYAAFALVGMDYQRDLYVRHIIRQKMTYSDIINKMFELNTDKQFDDIRMPKWYLEIIGTKSLSYELSNEQRRRNTWLNVQEIKSRADGKEERIRGLAPYYESGHIYHIKECPQLDEYEIELIQFPSGRHDDIIDAVSSVLEFASPPNAGRVARMGRDNDPRSQNRSNYKPRSALMGY